MSMYRRGYHFERRVRRYLEEHGFKVFRCAGSKPIDLIALSKDKIYLIECKASRKNIKEGARKLIECSKGACAVPVIAYRDGKNIVFLDPHTLSEVHL